MSQSIQDVSQPPILSNFADDPEFEDLLRMFVEMLPEKQRALEELFRAREIDKMREWAHQLKGAAGGYGFGELSVLAAELEDACKLRELDQIGEAHSRLIGHLGRISI